MKKLLLTPVVLFVIWLIASPYYVAYQMKSAAEEGDADAFSAYVDFPVLRENVKVQANALMAKKIAAKSEDDPLANLGAAFGSFVVDKMIDTYLTPEGMTKILSGDNPFLAKDSQDPEPPNDTDKSESEEGDIRDTELSYRSWDEFEIAFTNRENKTIRVILERRMLSWQMTNILLPEEEQK